MSVIARVTVDSEDFAIGDAFASVTDVHVDAEGIVPVSVGLVPYFWLGGTVDQRVVDPLREDDRVDAVSVVDSLEDRHLIRVDWDIERDAFLDTVDDTAGVVLEARREGDRWSFRLRFDDYDALSAFSRRCRDEGIDLELEQVSQPCLRRGSVHDRPHTGTARGARGCHRGRLLRGPAGDDARRTR